MITDYTHQSSHCGRETWHTAPLIKPASQEKYQLDNLFIGSVLHGQTVQRGRCLNNALPVCKLIFLSTNLKQCTEYNIYRLKIPNDCSN